MPKASPKHPIKKEVWGVVFLLLTIILGGSLLSYYPQDPLLWEKAGAIDHAKNLFGTIGAHLAGGLFLLLGLSSFWLIAILLFLSFSLFRGRFPSKAIWMSTNLIFLVISFSALLSLHISDGLAYRGTMISGGLVGLHSAGLGKKIFNYFGAYTLFLTIFIISFMVITRFSFGNLLNKIWIVASNVALYAREKWIKYTEMQGKNGSNTQKEEEGQDREKRRSKRSIRQGKGE
jgi:S-DNA-T family DNA segregation ATPase FtsK/SpoIIIE